MLDFIKSRRSTRKYKQDPVADEKIMQVVEAGRYAPSAKNCQQTHFIVIKNKDILAQLQKLVMQEFAKMDVNDAKYASVASSITMSKTGKYVFNYNAPILIVTANRKGYDNNYADCACALENMMLMANSLDLGSCWINQLRWLNENEVLVEYMQKLGMAENEIVCGSLALGYADNKDGMPLRTTTPRNGNKVTVVE